MGQKFLEYEIRRIRWSERKGCGDSLGNGAVTNVVGEAKTNK